MVQIPLFLIVRDDRFISSLNKLCEQDLPMKTSWKLVDVSEKAEEQRNKYRELYQKKVESCKTGETDENGVAILDPKKQEKASKEITEFAKSTMIEVESICVDEIEDVKLSALDIANLAGLITGKK
jgi:hypothetical protein